MSIYYLKDVSRLEQCFKIPEKNYIASNPSRKYNNILIKYIDRWIVVIVYKQIIKNVVLGAISYVQCSVLRIIYYYLRNLVFGLIVNDVPVYYN